MILRRGRADLTNGAVSGIVNILTERKVSMMTNKVREFTFSVWFADGKQESIITKGPTLTEARDLILQPLAALEASALVNLVVTSQNADGTEIRTEYEVEDLEMKDMLDYVMSFEKE
jgi:hypothetical protein